MCQCCSKYINTLFNPFNLQTVQSDEYYFTDEETEMHGHIREQFTSQKRKKGREIGVKRRKGNK